MSYLITVQAETIEELRSRLEDLLALNGGAVQPDPTPVPDVKPDKRKTEVEPKKKTAKKKAAKKKTAKKKTAKKAEPKLTYEDDVRPLLMELANSIPDGRKRTFKVLQAFGASNGADIKAEDFEAAIKLAKEELAEVKATEDEFEV